LLKCSYYQRIVTDGNGINPTGLKGLHRTPRAWRLPSLGPHRPLQLKW
jgi:hypothetical protein